MPKLTQQKQAIYALMLKAVNSPYGILVSTSNVDQLRQKCYGIKRGDPELFGNLSFRPSPNDPTKILLILKTEVIDNATPKEPRVSEEDVKPTSGGLRENGGDVPG